MDNTRMITVPPDSRLLAVFKTRLPRQLESAQGRFIVPVAGIASVISEQFELTVLVYAWVGHEVISVYRFKVKWVRTTLDSGKAVIAKVLTKIFYIPYVIAVRDTSDHENGIQYFMAFAAVDTAELAYLLSVSVGHFSLDLDIQVRRASSSAAVKQKIRQIELTVWKCETLRLILPAHLAGVEENRPPRLQP